MTHPRMLAAAVVTKAAVMAAPAPPNKALDIYESDVMREHMHLCSKGRARVARKTD